MTRATNGGKGNRRGLIPTGGKKRADTRTPTRHAESRVATGK
jgi:hypothetical protein